MEQMRRILVSNNFITKTNYFKLDNKQEYLNSDSRLLTVLSPLGEIHCSKDFILILTFVQYVISLYDVIIFLWWCLFHIYYLN